MNVFNKLTLRTLIKNRVRTAVTIIGVILSAAMICAVTTFAGSIYDYAFRITEWNNGSWHANETDTTLETYKDINGSDEVDKAVYLQQLGYAEAENCANKYKPYIYVLGASDGVSDMLPIHITSGKYPANKNEILLPEHLASNGGIKHELGDSITLSLGERKLDGYTLTQQNPAYSYVGGDEVLNEEVIEVKKEQTYKIVGFYKRLSHRIEPTTAPGYTAITLADNSFDGSYDIYYTLTKPKNIFKFMSDNGYEGEQNTEILMYQGAISFDGFSVMLTSLAAIVIALIVFGSVALIYNAFAISVSERTKQFGLLSSLGATRKQLRHMVMFEAATVAAIGIPIGIAAGIAGIGVTLAVIGNRFSALFGYSEIPMRMCVSWQATAAAVAIALLTVLISALIPSKRATHVTAVEAIRQSQDIKLESSHIKTSPIVYKLFGLSGVLASKHYKRNKKKYTATVISLFMSIVLFVSASSFTDYLTMTIGGGLTRGGYDLVYSVSSSELKGKTADDILSLLSSEENIKDATYVNEIYANGIISHKYLNQRAINILMVANANAPAGFEDKIDEYSSISAYIHFIPDDQYSALLKQYKLDAKKFINPDDPVGIALESGAVFDHEAGKYTKTEHLNSDNCEITYSSMLDKFYNNGEYSYCGEHTDENGNIIIEMTYGTDFDTVLEFPYDEVFATNTVKTAKTINEPPFFIDPDKTTALQLIFPESLYTAVIPSEIRSSDPYYRFYMTSSDHRQSATALQSTLNENGLATEYLYDYAESVEENRSLVTIIRVFAYGFIILISLIAAANVFNTISTNISLRRREFAMLKSVGMTQKGFNKMMNYECLLYGSKALLFGLPVSCGISYLIYLAVMSGFETSFRLPLSAIGIAILSVFLVVFATMMYSMNKIRHDDPIEALKNENL